MSLSKFTARFSQPTPSPDFGGARDLAHAAALVVAHGLRDLLLRVHHERAVAGDRLSDRNTGEQQQTAPPGAPRKRTASPSPSRASCPSRISWPPFPTSTEPSNRYASACCSRGSATVTSAPDSIVQS